MVQVRKHRAGSSSHGHVWAVDGQVLDVPEQDAYDLAAIPDGGFTIVQPPAQGEDTGDDRTEIDEAPHPARRGRRTVSRGRQYEVDPEITEAG